MTADFGRLAADQWDARRHRDQVLGPHFAGEAAWDMLLHLRSAAEVERRVSVSAATSAAGVPPTTALRAVDSLCRHGLVCRVADQSDRRRSFLELTLMGSYKVDEALIPPPRPRAPGQITRGSDGRLYLTVTFGPQPGKLQSASPVTAAKSSQVREATALIQRALALLDGAAL